MLFTQTGRASPETVQRLRQAEDHIGGCAQHHMQKVWLHWYETPGCVNLTRY